MRIFCVAQRQFTPRQHTEDSLVLIRRDMPSYVEAKHNLDAADEEKLWEQTLTTFFLSPRALAFIYSPSKET